MDLFTVLQIIIALIFIYFIVSLVVSELQEQLAAFRQWRARNLKQTIEIFVGDDVCKKLYGSDTLFSGFKQYTNPKIGGEGIGPSYIEPKIFAESLLVFISDRLKDENNKLSPNQKLFPEDQQEIGIIKKLDMIAELKENNQKNYQTVSKRLKDIAYITKLKHNNPTVENFANEIANTFEKILERTSGVYKRNAKGVSLFLGFVTAILFNIDTLYIVDQLYKDPSLRQSFDQLATNMVKENSLCLEAANDDEEAIKACQADLEARTQNLKTSFSENESLLIGWQQDSNFLAQIMAQGGPQKIIGWIISAIAISMGAPFWFDLLSKVVNVRNTVRPLSPAEKAKSASNAEDDSAS